MTRIRTRAPLVVVAVALCLAAAGCQGGRVTKANADKITTGMSEQEVINILGQPTENQEVSAGMPNVGAMLGGKEAPGGGNPFAGMGAGMKIRQCIWKEGDRVIVVQFMNGQVMQKVTQGL
jgi:hypothetical protein